MTFIPLGVGPKGVTSFTLLRLGVTWGQGTKAYQSGRFQKNWGLLPLQDLIHLLSDLRKKLKSQPYGVGDALVTLLGDNKALEVAGREGLTIRPMASTSTLKRSAPPEASSDFESSPAKKGRRA